MSSDPHDALTRLAPPARAESWGAFVAMVANVAHRATWPADLDEIRSWYQSHLEGTHEDAEVRSADLLQLQQIATGYPSRERFLTELTLDPPDATSDRAGPPLKDEDYLILSTIH